MVLIHLAHCINHAIISSDHFSAPLASDQPQDLIFHHLLLDPHGDKQHFFKPLWQKKKKKLLCSEVPCCTGTGGCMRTGYVSEWDKNEAPLWFVAWGDQSHPADRPETWQNVLFTLSQVQGTLFVQPFLHFVFASSPSLPCLSSTHLDLLPLSCHPFLLHLPPLLASALPTSLTTVSDSTFPVVHWLSLDRDSQSFCCCHLTTVLWFTLHLSTDLVQHVDLF